MGRGVPTDPKRVEREKRLSRVLATGTPPPVASPPGTLVPVRLPVVSRGIRPGPGLGLEAPLGTRGLPPVVKV
jgi:hypothetical protein